jgi:RNA polymerase sigma-70 factor (TIGR02960 family)
VSEVALARARAGDEQAFRELIDPHLRGLHVHCYRLLGSLPDAEDAVQDTLIAAWRGLPGFAARSSLRTWLYRIATNRCLNARRAAGRRLPPAPSPPFDPPVPTRHGEVPWLQPYPGPRDGTSDTGPGPEGRYESRETIELAFIAALQRLSPRQAAVLVLRDVLGFSTAEVAAMLDTTPTSVKGVLQRARAGVGGLRASGGRRPPEPGSAREQAVVQRFAAAFAADDIAGVIALLTDDAWLSMPPAAREYHGAAAVGAFLRASAGWRAGRRLQLVPARANTQPAFGCYLPRTRQNQAEAAGLIVLTLRGDQVSAITRFLDPDVLRRFGLPVAITRCPAPVVAGEDD